MNVVEISEYFLQSQDYKIMGEIMGVYKGQGKALAIMY